MNPFLQNRATTIAAAVVLAAIAACYSAAFGLLADMSTAALLANGAVFAATFAFECIIVWNIIKYVLRPMVSGYLNQYLMIIGFFVVVSTAGVELAVNYLVDSENLIAFAKTLPARGLVLALLYAAVVQFYNQRLNADDESDAEPTAEPLSAPTEVIDKITVRSGQKISVINIADVNFIKADGDYVSIATETGRWLKEQTMKYYEQNLPTADFVRVHRSYIVNVAKISKIERYGQQQLIELRNGEKIKVSNSGYKALKERLGL